MKLTTKGRYAIRAMLDIALHREQGAVSLAEISQRQKISQSYLEQLFAKLRRKELVDSVRGTGCVYTIHGDMQNITMAQILNAIDEHSLTATACCDQRNCQDGAECLTHELWLGLTDVIFNHLNHISLAEVVENLQVKYADGELLYCEESA